MAAGSSMCTQPSSIYEETKNYWDNFDFRATTATFLINIVYGRMMEGQGKEKEIKGAGANTWIRKQFSGHHKIEMQFSMAWASAEARRATQKAVL